MTVSTQTRIHIAHESPLSIFHEVQLRTSYDYALVHLFETSPEYYNCFERAIDKGRNVILDNSIFELGVAFDSGKFVNWIEKLRPQYAIVPDVLNDASATCESFMSFESEYGNRVSSERIGVVQGETYDDIVECYKFMSTNTDYVAISFDMNYFNVTGHGHNKLQLQATGRYRLIKSLISDGIWKHKCRHHLLGCSLAKEFAMYKFSQDTHSIYSIDTSNPVVAGLDHTRYGPNGLSNKSSVKLVDRMFEDVTAEQRRIIDYNIGEFTRIVHQ